MNGSIGSRDHLRLVQQWLEKNQKRVSSEAQIRVGAVRIDWSRYPSTLEGQLDISVDGEAPSPFFFSIDVAGRVHVSPPMFNSPLGAPASYEQIVFEGGMPASIADDVQSLLPPMRGVLWEDPIGSPITTRFPPDFDRLSWEAKMGNPKAVALGVPQPVSRSSRQTEEALASAVVPPVVPRASDRKTNIGCFLLVVLVVGTVALTSDWGGESPKSDQIKRCLDLAYTRFSSRNPDAEMTDDQMRAAVVRCTSEARADISD